MLQNALTPKENKVFQYVKEHPGSSQEEVVRGMKSDPSRITVINILKRLKEYDMILFKKDKPNSQIYKIYVNNNNLLVAVERSLSDFQQSFFVLLDHLKNKIEETYIERTGEIEGRDIDSVLSQLWRIHQWAIHGQILSKLRSGWTQQAQDKESLHRLYYLVFSTMMEIEYRFSEFFSYLRWKNINYDVNLSMDKGYDPGVRLPSFSPPEFVRVIPVSGYRWEVFDDWGLRNEAIDVGRCILKFIDMK
jgi:predicted transcriptional regulator